MKKIFLCLIATCLLLTFQPLESSTANTTASSSSMISKPIEPAEAKVLLLRLDEIKAMDKSNLSSSDKKNLRVEVRSIRHKLSDRDSHGGIYLSGGAVLLIIILLIILL